jgi:hypothetical protein
MEKILIVLIILLILVIPLSLIICKKTENKKKITSASSFNDNIKFFTIDENIKKTGLQIVMNSVSMEELDVKNPPAWISSLSVGDKLFISTVQPSTSNYIKTTIQGIMPFAQVNIPVGALSSIPYDSTGKFDETKFMSSYRNFVPYGTNRYHCSDDTGNINFFFNDGVQNLSNQTPGFNLAPRFQVKQTIFIYN